MIFTQANEYAAVLDACVLVPMALCDFLLRLAEEPALYRPLWSVDILNELSRTLQEKMKKTPEQAEWRLSQMQSAFPEAMVSFPTDLIKGMDCVPDPQDRHVLAAAVMGRASAIITQNLKHFPHECLEKYGVLIQSADGFLIDQYHLEQQVVLDKLDDQAIGISQTRAVVVGALKPSAPEFCKLLEAHLG